jgi:hypothetical protein
VKEISAFACGNLPGRTEKNHGNLRIACLRVEILLTKIMALHTE